MSRTQKRKKKNRQLSLDIFNLARKHVRLDDLLILNYMTSSRRRSLIGRRIDLVRDFLRSFRATEIIDQVAPDMKSIQPFSAEHWIVASHTFKPHPWKKVIVMGSGLTHQTARDAYQEAVARVCIPQSRGWMWWRRREGRVDRPFIGVGMT